MNEAPRWRGNETKSNYQERKEGEGGAEVKSDNGGRQLCLVAALLPSALPFWEPCHDQPFPGHRGQDTPLLCASMSRWVKNGIVMPAPLLLGVVVRAAGVHE